MRPTRWLALSWVLAACGPTGGGGLEPPEDPPWPVISNLNPHGEMVCTTALAPCNHQVALALGTGEDWDVLPEAVLFNASVPDPILVDHGVIEGHQWFELRVTYVDGYDGDMLDGVTQWVGLASLAFPASALRTPAEARALFAGETAWPWVFVRLELEGDDEVFDPNLEHFVGDAGDETWMITGMQQLYDDEGVRYPGDVVYATSEDGVRFGPLEPFYAFEEGARPGVDPDPFPLGWSDDYPRSLPVELAPWNGAEWGLHLSKPELFLSVGGPDAWTDVGQVTEDTSVCTTSVLDGAHQVFAARTGASAEGQTDVVRYAFDEGGVYDGPEVVLEATEAPMLASGMGSPTVVPLPSPGGLQLMVVQSFIRSEEDFE